MPIRSIAFSILIIAVCCVPVICQEKWVQMSADNGAIVFSVPGKYLVQRGTDGTRITATVVEGAVIVDYFKKQDAGKLVKEKPRYSDNDIDAQRTGGGDYHVRRYESDQRGHYYIAIHYGSGDTLLILSASGKAKTAPAIRQFVESITIADSAAIPGPHVDVSTLATSPEVSSASAASDAPEGSIKFEAFRTEDFRDDRQFSRRLLILSKPHVQYTDQARRAGVQGSVRARVEFLANGKIGSIVVDPTLDESLAANVGEAVRKIKFVPAEINGRPVDVVKILEYSFSIY